MSLINGIIIREQEIEGKILEYKTKIKEKKLKIKSELKEQKCKTCSVVKPVSNFYADKTYKYGYKKECKSCIKNRANTRYEGANKELIKKKNLLRYYMKKHNK